MNAETQPGAGVSLALDSDGTALTAKLTVSMRGGQPVTLRFLSSQNFDLEIRDAAGAVVYRWSRGRMFGQVVMPVELRGEKVYTITAPISGWKPGMYVAQAWLTAEGPDKAWSASAPFLVNP